MIESVTDWEPLRKKAKAKYRKRRMDDPLDDMKIMEMINWMKASRNREV